MTPDKWTWFGQAGHFCAADKCRFHLHTHVGKYCVSTVGEYFPGEATEPEQLGLDRLYETMVFQLDDNGTVFDLEERELRGYNDRDAAHTGHREMCEKWSER